MLCGLQALVGFLKFAKKTLLLGPLQTLDGFSLAMKSELGWRDFSSPLRDVDWHRNLCAFKATI